MDQQDFRKARNDGLTAGNDGKTRDDCPFPDGAIARMAWMRGFDAAQIAANAIEREATHY